MAPQVFTAESHHAWIVGPDVVATPTKGFGHRPRSWYVRGWHFFVGMIAPLTFSSALLNVYNMKEPQKPSSTGLMMITTGHVIEHPIACVDLMGTPSMCCTSSCHVFCARYLVTVLYRYIIVPVDSPLYYIVWLHTQWIQLPLQNN